MITVQPHTPHSKSMVSLSHNANEVDRRSGINEPGSSNGHINGLKRKIVFLEEDEDQDRGKRIMNANGLTGGNPLTNGHPRTVRSNALSNKKYADLQKQRKTLPIAKGLLGFQTTHHNGFANLCRSRTGCTHWGNTQKRYCGIARRDWIWKDNS